MRQKLIQALRQDMADHAESSLKSPGSEPDKSFAYGQVSGIYIGYQRALAALIKVLNEDEERDRDERFG